ncbi:prion-inhibition and propagation-domain-containing protein [Lasiosphaeria hispida]|uniref:Prion-inhibition and propagation-domain-containing protein n=1 Tax=Lasiosphaeria hispida TaxID=260671 RepID=A0AAJ0HTE8_9PEZI|nr:prion-inhibition and propagation-domain-containing protein [Lasiosphaeria hispida]
MAEVAGLALGVLGVAGLFKACIENFDIVVNAREFSEEFDLLCTELSLLRVRLVLWGETLGIVPCPEGAQVPYNKAIDRPDIRPAIEKSLSHLRLLLSKADVVTDRYELKEESAALQQSSKGLMIFRERFEAFKLSIRKNQKQKSAWKVTRWAIHDLDRFKSLVEKIKSLVDGLEGITSSLGVLERQQALLVKEVESISDAQSLRLLKEAASSRRSSSLRVVSDAASHRLSLFHASSLPVAESMSASGSSFYTAPSNPAQEASCILSISVENDCAGTQTGQEKRTSPSSSDIRDPATTLTQDSGQAWTTTSREGIPQHKRIMAHLLQKYGNTIQKPGFASGANAYGRAMAKVKDNDEHVWKQASPNLIYKASDNESTARRLFLELRTIREASVPFLSASPVGDSLDKILASIEGPPDTPYAGGIFWISVRIPANGSAPRLLFQTRIYHPNIDPAGRICADYQSWWNDQNLSKYMGFTSTCGAWFSSHGSNHFSLGALLTALCNLLANPDVDDPLVPEIAEIYVTDYERYCEAARLYTERYAHSPRPHDEEITFDGEEPEGNALLLRVGTLSMQSNTATSAPSLAATGFRVHHSALGERLVARDADQAPFPVSCHRMSKVIIHHVGFGDILPNIKIVLTLDGSEAVIENEQWNGTSDRPRVYPGVRLSRLGSLFVSEVML